MHPQLHPLEKVLRKNCFLALKSRSSEQLQIRWKTRTGIFMLHWLFQLRRFIFLLSVHYKQLSFYYFDLEISWLLRLLIKIIPQLGLKAPFYQENSFHEQQVLLMVVNLKHLHNHEHAIQIVESYLVKVVQVQRYQG